MNTKPEPATMTVYPVDGGWKYRIWDESGEVLEEGPIAWKGESTFHLKGLDYVFSKVPHGYVYQTWQEMDDGSYTAVLYRRGFR